MKVSAKADFPPRDAVWNTATTPKDKNAGKNPDDDLLRILEGRIDWTPLQLYSNAVTVKVTSP